jgi:hypothetical protein
MFKKSKVVMLPTEKASKIYKGYNGKLYIDPVLKSYGTVDRFHLYFLSDEEIKEGDWYIVELVKITGESSGYHVEQCKIIRDKIWVNSESMSSLDTRHIKNCKKIIASTDKLLKLPEPSERFLKKYCELGGIDEVMVEYEYGRLNSVANAGGISEGFKLKIAPDNTITIKSVRNSWNKEEVMSEVKRLILLERDYRNKYSHFINSEDLDKWIEENL